MPLYYIMLLLTFQEEMRPKKWVFLLLVGDGKGEPLRKLLTCAGGRTGPVKFNCSGARSVIIGVGIGGGVLRAHPELEITAGLPIQIPLKANLSALPLWTQIKGNIDGFSSFKGCRQIERLGRILINGACHLSIADILLTGQRGCR
jgi:hypothetical protein